MHVARTVARWICCDLVLEAVVASAGRGTARDGVAGALRRPMPRNAGPSAPGSRPTHRPPRPPALVGAARAGRPLPLLDCLPPAVAISGLFGGVLGAASGAVLTALVLLVLAQARGGAQDTERPAAPGQAATAAAPGGRGRKVRRHTAGGAGEAPGRAGRRIASGGRSAAGRGQGQDGGWWGRAGLTVSRHAGLLNGAGQRAGAIAPALRNCSARPMWDRARARAAGAFLPTRQESRRRCGVKPSDRVSNQSKTCQT